MATSRFASRGIRVKAFEVILREIQDGKTKPLADQIEEFLNSGSYTYIETAYSTVPGFQSALLFYRE